MPKSGLISARRRRERRSVRVTNAIEGQIAEICRDLAVETKRLRQLHEQAEQLHSAIRECSGRFAAARRAGTR